jgi:hypothetical protein
MKDPDMLLRIAKNHIEGGLLKLRQRPQDEDTTDLIAIYITIMEIVDYVAEKTGYEG